MPRLSLVVCLYREGDLLERLLEHSVGCYDDLVVVHDGPDDTGVRSLVERHGGRFFEQPRRYSGDPHWPFAWTQARHDWILRWDADEFPSDALRAWLMDFRGREEPPVEVSGFTCVLPLWDGKRARTKKWPQRVSILNRERVRHFGMAEQPPVPDGRWERLGLILHHQPKRKCYGIRYSVARPKVRHWYDDIGQALLGKPTDLPCLRWDDPHWPPKLEQIRRRPYWTALRRLVMSPIWNAREALQCGEIPRPSMLIQFPLRHWMTCMGYIKARRRARRGGSGAT